MTVIPIVHVASRARNNWRPFAFVSGAPSPYSTFVTSSNEAFALFLIKHYRTPLPPTKRLKVTKLIKNKRRMMMKKERTMRKKRMMKKRKTMMNKMKRTRKWMRMRKKTGRSTKSIEKEKANLQKEN